MTTSSTQIPPESLLVHADFVRGLARSLLFDDDHQVDDLVQQTWLQAIRQPPDQPAAARGFLATIVRNLASNRRRSEGRRRLREASHEPDRLQAPSTTEVVEREATRQQVVQSVLALDEPYRSTILLRYFEGLSPSEIARRQGKPAATVRTQLKRGLERLRVAMDNRSAGDRKAWCLQLVPLAAALERQAVVLPVAKLVLSVAAALVVILAGVGLWWSFKSEDPVQADTSLHGGAGGKSEAPRGVEEKREAKSPDARRQLVAAADERPTVVAPVGFRGRLLDIDGQPVGGADVRVYVLESQRLLYGETTAGPRLGSGVGRTDSDGSFLIEGLWPRGQYLVRSQHEDRGRLCRVVQQTPVPGTTQDLGDLHLQSSASITGTVVDADGLPISGALVWSTDVAGALLKGLRLDYLHPRGGVIAHGPGGPTVHATPKWARLLPDAAMVPNARTNQSGVFRLNGLPSGAHSVLVRAPGHRPMVRSGVKVKPGKRRDLGVLRMRQGGVVSGRVVDHDGRPVAAAQVLVAAKASPLARKMIGLGLQVDVAQPLTVSDNKGVFEVSGLPNGAATIAVRRAVGDPWQVFSEMRCGQEHECRLARSASLRVRVASLPAEGGDFELVQSHVGGELLFGNLAERVDLSRRLVRQEDGCRIDSLPPGPYTLLVRAKGRALAVRHVRLQGDLSVQLVLRPSAPMQVTVVDEAGQPLAGAQVFARAEKPTSWQRSIIPSYTPISCWGFVPTASATTNRQGQALLRGLQPGAVRVTAVHGEFGAVSSVARVPVRSVRLRFARPGGIRGVFEDGEEPARANQWALSLRRLDGVDPTAPAAKKRILLSPNAQGRFSLSGLAPGRYRLEVIPSPRLVGSIETMRSYLSAAPFGVFTSTVSKTVQIDSGQTVDVRINARPHAAGRDAAGTVVRGTVFVDGRPGTGCKVWVRGRFSMGFRSDKNAAVVDAAGRFSFSKMKSDARYQLEVMGPEGAELVSRELKVETGRVQQLDLVIRTGNLAGMLLDPEGRPMPGISVTAWQVADGQDLSRMSKTDAAGRFRFSGMPAGGYRLKAKAKVGFAAASCRVVASQEASATLKMQSLVVWSGSIDRQAFGVAAKAEASLRVRGAAGSEFVHLKSGSDFSLRVMPGPLEVYLIAKVGDSHRMFGGIQTITVPSEGAQNVKLRPKNAKK